MIINVVTIGTFKYNGMSPGAAITKINTKDTKTPGFMYQGRFFDDVSSGPASIAKVEASPRLRLKIALIINPITIDINIALNALAIPSPMPSTLAVKVIAKMLIAGPEYRKVVAGPMPPPLL
jgi:hypothetical protein